ncbi:MAG: phage tail sheath family protein [Ardenticatenaceae bacterium]|nr:phage tail sheath family protein [Ardenticatenaceae bacterium]HBY93086.1 phage tail sheath family protein [Chloroflexota bacterium]
MPQYLSPGVYVEEVPGTPPIVGVGTSTAAFIGVVDTTLTNPDGSAFEMPLLPGSDTDRYTLAPTNEARLVTNWGQFMNQFGDFHTANSTLAHAVYGFFNNGGTRCWVVRVDDLTNAGDVGAALDALEAIDEVAIVVAPGALDDAVQLAVIEHCENLKDRFAIIDGQRTTTIDVASIQGGVRDSDYAALYFPWIQVFDPVTDGNIFVPPGGHMAGIYARVDQERGVHKAPANVIVRGALGLEYLVTKNEQDGLNPDGINVIRKFNDTIKVWGARTLGGDDNGEFKYINVRRLMNFLRESLDEGTQFVVFEPNSPALWERIKRSVRAFLTNVWRDGALFGNTPEEGFYVKCDESTNPPEVRELGQVITEIGVAIVKPAEFVIFRISQITLPSA